MSLERNLLSTFLKSRDAWDKIRDKISDSAFEQSPYTSKLLGLMDEFYNKDKSATRIDVPVILKQAEMRVANVKHKDTLVQLIKELDESDVSVDNVVDLALEIKRKEIGEKLGLAILNGQDVDAQAKLMSEYEELLAATSFEETEENEDYNNMSVQSIINASLDPEALIKLAPKALNDRLDGGALRGHHITFFARPEAGKTAAMMTMLHGFILQNLNVIYFGNEDPIFQVMQRGMSCVTGMTKQQIVADPARAEALLARRSWSKARFIPLTPGSPWEIEKYVKKYRPDVIIVDQIRNILVKAGTKVEQLEEAAKAIRQIGKKHSCLVVSVTQAGDSASNKLVLEMNDVDFSNTGIPSQADVMIGMGFNQEYDKQGMRMFSLPKNKLSGSHEHFQVRIMTQISRIESL